MHKSNSSLHGNFTMTTELPEPLRLYVADWNAAGVRWNSEALADCFTPDGLFFGGRPEHSVGHEAILAYFRSYVGIIESCTLQLRDQQLVDLGSQGLVAQGYGDFSFVLAGQRPTRSTVRTTLMLVQLGGRWRARVQHFGPPPLVPPLGDKG